MDTTILRCPACGSNLRFDATIQRWRCESCFNIYAQEDVYKITSDSDLDNKTQGRDIEQQPELDVYRCQSCGAEMVTDQNTTATFCIYCHNPGIIKHRLEGKFRPDYIIPFTKSKKDAEEAYRKCCKGKYIAPAEFANPDNIQKITGVYVPFWLYDGDSRSHVSGLRTTSSSVRDGDYIVTTTFKYRVERTGNMRFYRVPADASVKFDDNTMDSIEPYNFEGLIPFNYSYLSGFLAEKYDVDVNEDVSRVKRRMENTIMSEIYATIPGGTLNGVTEHKETTFGDVRYALLPVWMVNTIVNGKPYTFAMNGQTGRMVGDIPISVPRLLAFFAIIFLVAMSVLCAVSYIFFM